MPTLSTRKAHDSKVFSFLAPQVTEHAETKYYFVKYENGKQAPVKTNRPSRQISP
ncbi:hypothetical protein PGB90_008363 [Kerria lacca]